MTQEEDAQTPLIDPALVHMFVTQWNLLRDLMALFDSGKARAALPLAVTIRGLVYDKSSPSLLTQMGVKSSLTWLASGGEADPDPNRTKLPTLTSVEMTSSEDTATMRYLPRPEEYIIDPAG